MLSLYVTSSIGFVFCFKNIIEKKLTEGRMPIKNNSKECITHLEIEKFEGKNIMFLLFYDGVVCIYSYELEV